MDIEGDGNVFCYGNTPGAVCDVTCPYGYELQGDNQLKCGDDGEWKGKIYSREHTGSHLNTFHPILWINRPQLVRESLIRTSGLSLIRSPIWKLQSIF